MLTRHLLVQALSRTPNGDQPAAYDEVTAIRVAEDCLAIFAHEISQVAPQMLADQGSAVGSPGNRLDHQVAVGRADGSHGEDLLLVPTRRPESFLTDDHLAAEAIRRQDEWLRPLYDDAC